MGADPHLAEPVQRPGEPWGDFYARWAASPFGVARRAQAEELARSFGEEPRRQGHRRRVHALNDHTGGRFRGP